MIQFYLPLTLIQVLNHHLTLKQFLRAKILQHYPFKLHFPSTHDSHKGHDGTYERLFPEFSSVKAPKRHCGGGETQQIDF